LELFKFLLCFENILFGLRNVQNTSTMGYEGFVNLGSLMAGLRLEGLEGCQQGFYPLPALKRA